MFFPLVRILCELRLGSRKSVNIFLMRNLWNFSSFGRGEVSPPHSELCCFVSGSQAKHQVLSPVIILLEICLSTSAIAITSCQDVPRTSLCSGANECGTKRTHKLSFPNPLSKSRKLQCSGCSETLLSFLCDSKIIFDQISNSSNVYFSSNQFRTAISLVLFYQLPSISKSRIPPKIN